MLRVIGLIFAIGFLLFKCPAQSIIDSKDGLQVSINLLQNDDSTVWMVAKITNKRIEPLYILKIDPNQGASFVSLEEILLDMTNPFDALHSPDLFIDLYQIGPGESIEVTKTKCTTIDRIKYIQLQVEVFQESQVASGDEGKKLLRGFRKSVKAGHPKISIKHYVQRNSYQSVVFKFKL